MNPNIIKRAKDKQRYQIHKKKEKENAIAFAEFVSNDVVFDDFCFMSKEAQDQIYQEFLNQNKDE